MNWTILNRLVGDDDQFQLFTDVMHHAINEGWAHGAGRYAEAAASIAHELMDRADDLDELEREDLPMGQYD
jgi:hypothetical protein